MAWNAEARKKAAESRRLSGKLNQWTKEEGYNLSDITREKMSSTSKGRLHTEDTKRLMSEKQETLNIGD